MSDDQNEYDLDIKNFDIDGWDAAGFDRKLLIFRWISGLALIIWMSVYLFI